MHLLSRTYFKPILIILSLAILLLMCFRVGQYSNDIQSMKRAIQMAGANRNTSQEVLSWDPRVSLKKGFLSEDECDYIIKLGESKLSRSTVVGDNGKSVVDNYRTSDGTFFHKEMNDPVLQLIEDKIASWTHIPSENGEVFYLLRYKIGQEYKPHTDWYLDSGPDKEYFNGQGNRIATVLMYLSDVEQGGETFFPRADLSIKPSKGDAILFWNLKPDGLPDLNSLHGGKPVIKGTKWCMTKWIRQKKARR